MFLTDEQKRMRDGERGEPVQVAMEMLCALGEIYGAEKLIPVKSAHCAGPVSYTHLDVYKRQLYQCRVAGHDGD